TVNAKPDAGVHTTSGAGSTASVAVTVNDTTVVAPVASVVMSAGSDSTGAVVSVPVPVSATAVEPSLTLETVSVADFAPTAAGVNVTSTDADAPAGIVDVAGAVAANDGASGPITSGASMVMLVGGTLTVAVARKLFLTVTGRVDAAPTATDPKSSSDGDDV